MKEGKDETKNEPGAKFDAGKNRLDLIPALPLWRVGEVYTIGAGKYADRNWERGMSYSRLYGAALRHLLRWFSGEMNDPIDGQHHLASVVFSCLALMEYEETHPEFDDRPRKVILP